MSNCPLCNCTTEEDTVTLTSKGAATLLKAVQERGAGDGSNIVAGAVVHTKCRLRYTRNAIKRSLSSDAPNRASLPDDDRARSMVQNLGPDKRRRTSAGRPENSKRFTAFCGAAKRLLEPPGAVTTVADLQNEMSIALKDSDEEPYRWRHMMTMLKRKYEADLIISKSTGRPDIVTLKRTSQGLVRSQYDEKEEIEDEQIVAAAAKIIRRDNL